MQSLVVCVCILEWRVLAFFRFCVQDFPFEYNFVVVVYIFEEDSQIVKLTNQEGFVKA